MTRGRAITVEQPEVQAVATDLTLQDYLNLVDEVLDIPDDEVIRSPHA